jgi:hypothetical protein
LVSVISEISSLRVRQKASKLFLPTLLLAAASFALSFFAETMAQEIYELLLIGVGVAVLLFWLVPLMNFLLGYLELTNLRLVYRFGLFGFRKRTMQLLELSSIEIQRTKFLSGKVISILAVDGSEIRVSGYARTKLLAAEIEDLASKA